MKVLPSLILLVRNLNFEAERVREGERETERERQRERDRQRER